MLSNAGFKLVQVVLNLAEAGLKMGLVKLMLSPVRLKPSQAGSSGVEVGSSWSLFAAAVRKAYYFEHVVGSLGLSHNLGLGT